GQVNRRNRRRQQDNSEHGETTRVRTPGRLRTRGAVLFTAGMLALAGCGSAKPAVIAAPGVPQTTCGTLRLAVNAWVGYEANAAVISYLARQELGCDVKLIREDEEHA